MAAVSHRCFVRLLRSTSGSFERASELRSIGGSVVVRPSHLRLLDDDGRPGDPTLVESYRRLADVFHEVLAEQSLDALLVRIADTVGDLIPSLDTLTIYEADETKLVLKPVLVRDVYADEIMSTTISFSEGITGWATRHREAVCSNQAHLDPRVRTVPGTPMEPEALICVPLIARGQIKGALNIYREGDAVAFSETEFEIAKRFGDAAALALDNAEIRARLEHQARTDSLTGLFNHSVFYERLLQSLQEASRTHLPLAVLMLDIDDFKHVNDVHGHAVGDELLRFLAEALRAIVRPEDVICRLGGEEFAVVMDGCGGENAVSVADRVQSRLAEVDFPGIGRMTVSVGLALGPEHGMNPRELAACAEAAMMTAKAQGKNQVVLYDEAGARRPDAPGVERDVRSIAHLKMLQTLTGRLNRLNDVREIGDAIAAELRSLVDYHNCRVFVADGDELIPVAFLGDLTSGMDSISLDILRKRVGEGVTGPLRRARRVDHRRRRRELRVRAADRGHRPDRGVAPRRAAALRQPRRRRDRRLQARAEPVRRGRRPAARGARRPCGGRRREREPVRVGAPRGRERDLAARVRPRARDPRRPRGHRGARHRAVRGDPRQQQHVLLPRDGRSADAARASTGTRRRRPRSSRRIRCRSTSCGVTAEAVHRRAARVRAADREGDRPRRSLRESRRSRSTAARAASSRSSSGTTSGSASSRCSPASRSRRGSRSPTPRATRGSSGRSYPPSRRSPTRSRRTTSTRPRMRAGSRISPFASAASSASTSGR